ncbi:tetratricopeptide repeat protein [uncultured Desulfobulbus sp.]|uniref:O-linked N-acetylglucosamine transferase family protein n=1 Tax=uncultured Desulfobulbus sp. TaxID=239745 RepID=UPI0029C8A670|nr:tetratricopeptide repeat protein [uncultured Desulfobulbus sp.]
MENCVDEVGLSFTAAARGEMELVELVSILERWTAGGDRTNEVLELYRIWIEHTSSPLVFVACYNCAVEYAKAHDYAQAESMYRKALDHNPNFIQARINLGNCLEQQKREDEALEQWRTALATQSISLPENKALRLHALNNLGRLLETKRQFQEALSALTLSYNLDPTQQDVLYHLVPLRGKICAWPVIRPPKGISKTEMINGASPLGVLALSDDPSLQLSCARKFVERKYLVKSEPLAPTGGYRHKKIKIGYLSSDLSMHAVSFLTVELFERHNREQFEVYGFCWSREDGSAFRQRVVAAMDHVVRIGSMNDKQAAESIRAHEIDIMVDLHGLTSGARPEILAYRPAPLQITYLGFPGPTGLPWIDYVVADHYLIPEESAQHFTEKPLYMPHCFQVSDSKREVAHKPSRAEYFLPEDVFVYCSFNNNYKYTHKMFATWMRILKKVPKSVLWLLADNEWAHDNLLKAAKKHGVEKDRLIFAPRVMPSAYLARYQLADLFLDTFPFNGGTTANDALFMGLPLLTLSGQTFASRMAGSLLTNLDLPELITTSFKEYEEKSVELARQSGELKRIRDRLINGKNSSPVFDIPRLVQDFENSLVELIQERTSWCDELDRSRKDKSILNILVKEASAERNFDTNIINPLKNNDSIIVKDVMPKKIAIASIQRDRGPWIIEWLAFHMLIGFNQFYIYVHKSIDDMTIKLLKLSQHYPIVVHQVSTDDRPQLSCYQHAYNSYGQLVDWMAFIDGDEFLFPTAKSQMAAALAEYEDKEMSAIAAFWVCYGSSGHLREPEGLIVENYRRHSSFDFLPNRHVKSIVKGRQNGIMTTASHVFSTPRGTYDELRRPINHGLMEKLTPSYKQFRINHYATQSYDFFLRIKQNMGAADSDSTYVRSPEWYFRYDRNECDDGISYNFLIPLKLKVIELTNAISY